MMCDFMAMSCTVDEYREICGVDEDDSPVCCVVCGESESILNQGDVYILEDDGVDEDERGPHCRKCQQLVCDEMEKQARAEAISDIEFCGELSLEDSHRILAKGRLLTRDHLIDMGVLNSLTSDRYDHINDSGEPDWWAIRNHLRHQYTNYESCIRDLSRESFCWWDQILYCAYRKRAEEVVDEKIEKLEAESKENDAVEGREGQIG